MTNTHRAGGRQSSPRQRRRQPRRSGALSPRQRQVLQWLLRLPMLRVDDLTVLTGTSRSTMVRTVRELETRGRVECVRPAGLSTQGVTYLYHLTDDGLRTIARVQHADPLELARAHGSTERALLRLLPQLPQLVRVQALLTGLIADAQSALAIQGHLSAGSWHIVRPYHLSFLSHGRSCRLEVAGAVTFHLQNEDGASGDSTAGPSASPLDWYSALVVADTPAFDWRRAERQVELLLRYRESEERWTTYPQFPLVLILASSVRHLERWQQLVQVSAQRLHVPPLVCAAIVGPSLDAISQPWSQAWYDLRSGRAQHLRHLWPPLTYESLPPGLDGSAGSESAAPVSGRQRRPNRSKRVSGQSDARIIVGHFMEHGAARWPVAAQAIAMLHERDMSTRRRHETPARKRQTRDAELPTPRRDDVQFLSLYVTTRQQAVLTQLFVTPYLNVSQLAALMAVQGESMDRYIRTLRHMGLVAFADAAASPSHGDTEFQQLTLTALGRGVIAAAMGLPMPAREARRTFRGPGGKAAHRQGVYDFFASLVTAARTASTDTVPHRLLWWETGALCELRYRDHGRWHNLRPDGAGVYRIGTRRIHFWLEYDTGTMNYRDLVVKFSSYAAYLATGQWRAFSASTLPMLLVVAPDRSQRDRLMRAATNAFQLHAPHPAASSEHAIGTGHASRIHAYVTLADRLAVAGPLAEIWWPMVLTPASEDELRRVITSQAVFVAASQ